MRTRNGLAQFLLLCLLGLASKANAEPAINSLYDGMEKSLTPLFEQFIRYSNEADLMYQMSHVDISLLTREQVQELQKQKVVLEQAHEAHQELIYEMGTQLGKVEFVNRHPTANNQVDKLNDLLADRSIARMVIRMRLASAQYGRALDSAGEPLDLHKLDQLAESCVDFVSQVRLVKPKNSNK